ncbi:MAG: hypothetical protein ACTSSM_09700, partial [Promethearchaeota archaeon]
RIVSVIKMIWNVEKLLEGLNLSKEEKEKIIKEVKNEFLNDEMLFELHVYRIVEYIKRKRKRN